VANHGQRRLAAASPRPPTGGDVLTIDPPPARQRAGHDRDRCRPVRCPLASAPGRPPAPRRAGRGHARSEVGVDRMVERYAPTVTSPSGSSTTASTRASATPSWAATSTPWRLCTSFTRRGVRLPDRRHAAVAQRHRLPGGAGANLGLRGARLLSWLAILAGRVPRHELRGRTAPPHRRPVARRRGAGRAGDFVGDLQTSMRGSARAGVGGCSAAPVGFVIVTTLEPAASPRPSTSPPSFGSWRCRSVASWSTGCSGLPRRRGGDPAADVLADDHRGAQALSRAIGASVDGPAAVALDAATGSSLSSPSGGAPARPLERIADVAAVQVRSSPHR